jgi:hypothetical protein
MLHDNNQKTRQCGCDWLCMWVPTHSHTTTHNNTQTHNTFEIFPSSNLVGLGYFMRPTFRYLSTQHHSSNSVSRHTLV